MKKVVLIILLLILLSISLNFAGESKIASEVVRVLDNEDTARVAVVLNQNIGEPEIRVFSERRGSINEEKIKHKFENSFSAEITQSDLEILEKDSRVVSVSVENIKHIFLQQSVPMINVSSVWNIDSSGLNISGDGEAICILDTGVNYSQAALGGCFGVGCKVVGGYDFVNDDTDPMDDHGHGTHVAGIVGANGSIEGVARDANIVAVKVCNSGGSCADSDIKAGIDWCVGNSSAYNISVISLSLGSGSYSSYCDYIDDSFNITSSINQAVLKNISVIAATGNDGNISGISSPACIRNATSVADVYDANVGSLNWIGTCNDTSTLQDKIVCHANRNNITELFAPGALINSTWLSGYSRQGGTSMATPHVSAAFALIRQFYRLQSDRILEPWEIQATLNNTGVIIYDNATDTTINGTGLNFSRIDVYSAILSLDEAYPNITLGQPADSLASNFQNQIFSCNASDLQLKNLTLQIWNSTDIYNINKTAVTGSFNQTNFSVTNLDYDDYTWNCYFCDLKDNCGYASSNFSLSIRQVAVNLISPLNNSYTSEQVNNFSCNATTQSDLTNLTLQIWNSTGLVYNQTENISGTENQTEVSLNFSLLSFAEESYKWNCFVKDNQSNQNLASSNFSFVYDTTSPIINLSDPNNAATTTSTIIGFEFNVSDSSDIGNCSLIINGALSSLNTTLVNKSSLNTISQTLAIGSYTWRINCSDLANNIGNSSSRSLTIVASADPDTGGSSGGGSSTTYTTYVISDSQLEKGYTRELEEDERVRFYVLSVSGAKASHHLSIEEVTDTSIKLNITSNTVYATLIIGQEEKFDLSGDNFYDLYLRLNSIDDGKANLTIKSIYEEVQVQDLNREDLAADTNNTQTVEPIAGYSRWDWKINLKKYIVIILVIIVLVVIFIVYLRLKDARKKIKTKFKGK